MKVYLDMDGVLVDYIHPLLTVFNMTKEELLARWRPGVYEVSKALGMDYDKVWSTVKGLDESFWVNMPEYPWTRELWKKCNGLGETRILSAPLNCGASASGKIKWLHAFTGDENFYGYHLTYYKEDCARWNHLLIDDKEENCDKFIAAGGRAILFPAYWNRLHKHWQNPYEHIETQIDLHVDEIKFAEERGRV